MDWILTLTTIDTLFGITVPRISVYIIYLIVGCFAIALVWLLSNFFAVFASIRQASKDLRGYSAPFEANNQETLREKFSKNRLLSDIWEEFNESLIAVRASGGDATYLYNTQQSHHFFSPDYVIEHNLDRSLYGAIPGLLTSLGLLGTFLSLFFAMHSLHVQGSGQVQGIEGFINNLSGKFVSSICGLALALLFLIIEKFMTGSLHRECLGLQKRIDRLFKMHLQEELLAKMVTALQEQSATFKLFNADLAGCLKESFRDSLGPTMERLINAVEKLELATDEMKRQKEESSTKALEGMLDQFQQSLTGAANAEISKLSSVLSETSEFALGMNERMSSFLTHVDKMIVTQRENSESYNRSLSDAVMGLVDKLEVSSQTQLSGIQHTVSSLIENTSGLTEHLKVQLDEGAQKQSQALEAMMTSMRSASEEHWQRTNSQINGLVEIVSGSSKGIITSVEHLANKVIHDEKRAQDLLSSVSSSVDSFRTTVENNRSLVAEIRTVVNSLEAAGTQIERTSSSLKDSSTVTKATLDHLNTGLQQQQASITEIQQLWSKQKELYDVIDQRLGQAVRTINEAMVEYSNSTTEGLSRHLQEFDKQLAEACRRLGTTVEDLEEQLVELSDGIEKSVARIPTRSGS